MQKLHKFKKGDTLSAIKQEEWYDQMKSFQNGIQDANKISIGQA